MTDLVPSAQRDDGIQELRARCVELEALFTERAAELTRLKQELAAFKIGYRQQVGLLHEELDELELALAAAELGQLSNRPEVDSVPTGTPPAEEPSEPLPRFTSDAVRKLFRDVARAIHPDLAGDAAARDRRHALMVEANRAYAIGDEERLRWILESWQGSPDAVEGSDAAAARLRLERRCAQLEEQLVVFDGDLAALKDSPMGKLKAMVDDAAANGRDLVGELVKRLQRDIMITRNRLDAILWTPKGDLPDLPRTPVD